MNYDHVEHRTAGNHTIEGAIKYHNKYDIKADEMVELVRRYNLLNNGKVPRIGDTIKIPMLDWG